MSSPLLHKAIHGHLTKYACQFSPAPLLQHLLHLQHLQHFHYLPSLMLASPASRFDSGTATALSHSDRMPIRERIKKTFSSRRKPSISSLSPLEQAVNTPLPASKSRSRTSKSSKSKSASDALYYLPGEKLPLKYRRPVEKEHRDKLAAFSWQQKMKRNSAASQYSPMGSRMPSREASLDDPQIRMFAGTGLDKPWPNAIQGQPCSAHTPAF